jgi:N4-gp56 family major capsid protein
MATNRFEFLVGRRRVYRRRDPAAGARSSWPTSSAIRWTLPEGRGTTYTAVRYNRLPLPFAPLSEGVPPVGQTMSISTVSATAQQWGDKVTITDVAELTIKHPVFKKAIELTALQVSETWSGTPSTP